MASDLGTVDNGLASEFVRFLNSQLKESRDQLKRSVEVSITLIAVQRTDSVIVRKMQRCSKL